MEIPEFKTYLETINVTVPAGGNRNFFVGVKFPKQIKSIYGLSVQVDGVDPDNSVLITLANASDLYITILEGSNRIINALRLSDLVYLPDPDGTGAIAHTDSRFMPVNISNDISLDKSFFDNPTGITAGRILLNLWYIPV